ncbi:ProQ/FINO family protein [Klebsiella aerogenes]|uniref:ProQ/FINO family protein n=1 Tax=Klebsiella aerogenes TaxID=548 RepID=UPI002E350759|nr:ProQ/FINO family protein [Klebsiella aerogenes]MED7793127.1 ProQ/FINO family protein [Klebsiella aerogenes]
MSTDRPVLSLKRKPNPDRESRNSSVPVMVKGKRLESPRHRKKSEDAPTSAIDRFNQAVNTPPGKRMKRPGQPSPVKSVPAPVAAPTSLPVVARKKGKPGRPARLMDYQEALDLIRNAWPVLVTEECCRLLKIGITGDMQDNLQARGLDISNKKLRRALKTLARSAPYLQAQQAGAVRHDIHGLPAGTVTEEEAQSALKRLAALRLPEAEPDNSLTGETR